MRTRFARLLLSLFFCGCSQTHNTPSVSAIDLIQAGRNISCGGGKYVIHVERRDGRLLEGVRIVSHEADGQTATVTAEKAWLSQDLDVSVVKVVLHDAHMEKGRQKSIFAEMTFNLIVPEHP